MTAPARARFRWAAAWIAIAAAAGLGACGGRGERDSEPPQAEVLPDSLQQLASEVAVRFGDLVVDTTGARGLRDTVEHSAASLARAVLARERPQGGWTPASYEEALRRFQLAAEVREPTGGGEPWIALLGDPRGSGAPEVALLLYPDAGALAPLAHEPFRSPFQSATWSDSAGTHLLVAGSRRSPAGPQPAAWRFRLPEDPAQVDRERLLRPSDEWGLAGAGYGRVTLRRDSTAGPPVISVHNSTLPNPLFDECASCPHVEADLLYKIEGGTLAPAKRVIRHTPYAAFVGFVQALVDGDAVAASGFVADSSVLGQARRFGFAHRPSGGRWRLAPGTSSTNLDAVYLRGGEGAYRVLMAPGDTNFVVLSITPTVHSLD